MALTHLRWYGVVACAHQAPHTSTTDNSSFTLGAYVRYTWCLCALHLVLMFVTFGAYVRYIWCLCSLHLVLMCVTLNAYVRYIWCLYALHLVLKWRLALANQHLNK